MCDVERLLFLIKNRPAIYNSKLKAHNDKRVQEKLWSEIAKGMDTTAKACKTKYTSLRSAYSRFLREQPAPGSAPKKKSWYLASAMSFMRTHMTARTRNSQKHETDAEDDAKMSDCAESRDYSLTSTACTNRPNAMTETTTERDANAKTLRSENEEANHTFFKSMLPDMQKLTDKNQRKLKQDFLLNLNNLLEQQELGNMPIRKFSLN